MKKRYYLSMATLALALVLGGCKTEGEKSHDKQAILENWAEARSEEEQAAQSEVGRRPVGTGEAEQEIESSWSEEQEQELYNAYIGINNFMVGRLDDSLQRYFKYVEFQEEFKPFDKDYDCHSISDYQFEDLEEAYTLASGKPEKNSVDEAFLAMYPSIKGVMTALDEIYDYTDMKSYLDDDYARGKEYHAALWTAYGDFEVTGNQFFEELGRMADERKMAALEQMEKEGLEVYYAINMVLITAQDIEAEFYNQGLTDDNILEMDMEIFQPKYDEFVSYVEQVMAYSKDSEKLAEESVPVNSAYWNSFLHAMKDTKTSLTELFQHVKEQKPLSMSDTLITEISGNCSIGSFETGIKDMVNNYNYMLR